MNRQQYNNQYNLTQFADYSQANSSHYSSYNQQEQAWYSDQYSRQNFNYANSSNFNTSQQSHQSRAQRQNYGRPNNYQQSYHSQQQNYAQQNGHFPSLPSSSSNQNYQKWGNNNGNNNSRMKNKRSHDFVEPFQSVSSSSIHSNSSQTASPEPKRQVQRQNSLPNMHQQQPAAAAAYQTQATNAPAWKLAKQHQQQQQSPQRRKKGGNSIVETFHEQKTKEWNETFTRTMTLLSGCCRAGEEVQILLSNLQPSRSVWSKTKEQIFNDLSKVMTPLGIEKILTFGSTLTGLDFHGSDLDFFIQLKKMPSTEDEIRDAIRRSAKLTRYLQGNDFYVMCTIPNARVPLIRLMHKHTRVTCDINFNSRFGYYNSYFISHVLGYDKRIRELAIILKLWSKSHRIASQMILSNYCLMMLMIFYLQNLENPMLDTIYNNQQSGKPMILDLNYKWNFYFNDNINNACHNHLSLRELLIGFFEFYEKLNYNNYVISLYTGNLIKRTDFDTLPELEEFRNLIRVNNLMPLKVDNPGTFIVQDGFELNLNVGTKVKKHTDALLEYVKLSFEKCNELKDKPFSELLIKLFTDIQVSKKDSGEGKNKNRKKFQMKIHAIAGDLKVCQDILLHQDKEKIYSVEDQQKFFFDHTVDHSRKFLKDIYLCTIVPEISEEAQPDAMSARFKVILKLDTINGRKKMSFKDDETLEAEKTLSMKMMEKKVCLDLDVLMVISSIDKGKTIDIDMFDNNPNKKSPLLAFGNYFSINIAQAMKFYLKKRWDEILKN